VSIIAINNAILNSNTRAERCHRNTNTVRC